MASTGYSLYKLGMEGSPIILTGGIATLIPGGMLPIIAITESLNLLDGLLSGMSVLNLDNLLCHYSFNPGTELIRNEVATYPFANQTVAANSIIAQPKRISYTMVCPAKALGGVYFKLAALTALQLALETHNSSGGLYTLVTPSKIYTNCIMVGFTNNDGGATKQQQYQWQIEFTQPLITESAAVSTQNSLLGKMTGQTQITLPSWSSAATSAANAAGIQLPASLSSSVQSLKSLFGGLTGAPSL